MQDPARHVHPNRTRTISLLRFAFRSLLRHPWRNLATILGVALAIATLLATLSAGENIRINVAASLESAAGAAELLVTPGAEGRAVFSLADAEEAILATPGVAAARPVLSYRAEPIRQEQLLTDAPSTFIMGLDTGFLLVGRVTEDPDFLPAAVATGVLPGPGSNGIALTRDFAELRQIEIGEVLGFATTFGEIPFTVVGYLDDAIGLASTNGGRIGLLHIRDLQQALHLEGRVTNVEVMLAPDADPNAVRSALSTALGADYAISLPARGGDVVIGFLDSLEAVLRMLALILLVLGGFLAYNTFAAAATERAREYALLRTICMTVRQVAGLALLEVALLGVCAVALGLLLGVLFSYGTVRAYAWLLEFEYRTLSMPVGQLVLAGLAGMAVMLLAGLLPARTASQAAPSTAYRTAMAGAGPVPRARAGMVILLLGVTAALLPWRGISALAGGFLAMALLFLGLTLVLPRGFVAMEPLRPLAQRLFGPVGRIGLSFMLRNASRNAVALATVAVAVCLAIGIGSAMAGLNATIAHWVDTTVIGDLYVSSPVGFPAGFEEQVREEVPEVEEVAGIGIRVARYQPENQVRGRSVAVVFTDPESLDPVTGFARLSFIQGQGSERAAYEALKAGGAVLVGSPIMDRFGVGVGDTVSLRTTEGFRDFPVAGVIVSFYGGGETVMASTADMPLFGGGLPDFYLLKVAPEADLAATREKIVAAFPRLFLEVSLNQTYRNYIYAVAGRVSAAIGSLLVLTMLLASLAVSNTLGMNLEDRHRELVLLRTLGLTRPGLRRLITIEGIVLVFWGAVLGALCGLLLSRILVTGMIALAHFRVIPVFPWQLVAVALLVAPLVGLLASFLPARRAAVIPPETSARGVG